MPPTPLSPLVAVQDVCGNVSYKLGWLLTTKYPLFLLIPPLFPNLPYGRINVSYRNSSPFTLKERSAIRMTFPSEGVTKMLRWRLLSTVDETLFASLPRNWNPNNDCIIILKNNTLSKTFFANWMKLVYLITIAVFSFKVEVFLLIC